MLQLKGNRLKERFFSRTFSVRRALEDRRQRKADIVRIVEQAHFVCDSRLFLPAHHAQHDETEEDVQAVD